MEQVLLDEVVRTDYGQFDIVWEELGGFDGNWERFFAGQVNGLVGASDPGGVYVNLGRRSGGSRIRIVLLDSPRPAVDLYYEDVVEVSVTIPADAQVQWLSWAGQSFGPLNDLLPGSYRLRVSAHGRDAGSNGEFVEHVVDEYLLQFWRSDVATDEILQVGSENAQY